MHRDRTGTQTCPVPLAPRVPGAYGVKASAGRLTALGSPCLSQVRQW